MPKHDAGLAIALQQGGSMRRETAILGGGCYWGVQGLLRDQAGVISTRVGYSGGNTPHPTDENSGDHAEAVEVVFDPDVLSYRDLLEFFLQIHDPTTLNRQGDEEGRSVRSAIFYTDDEQRRTALATIADADASGLWPGKVVTEVAAAGPFWEAEDDEQDYLQKHPEVETCHFIRPDWRLPRRRTEEVSGPGVTS
jgi:peptide-methionine (S)-S-oxide reductase